MAKPLEGRRVLVVEDEYFLADDIARALRALGAEVVGPAGESGEALATLSTAAVDLAILDVNLAGDMVFPLAETLRAYGIPFVFATGYAETALPAEYRGVPRWEKPFNPEALANALPRLMRKQ